MNKKYQFFFLTFAFLFLSTQAVMAKQGEPTNPQAVSQGSNAGVMVQNQNQVSTQNMGEDSELKVSTQEQEDQGEEMDDESDDQELSTGSAGRAEQAEEKMSQVAQEVENLLQSKMVEQTGIGQEVKKIAQAQQTAQNKIGQELTKLSSRSNLIKKLFGSSSKTLGELQTLREENQLRIRQLTELKTQLKNTGDADQIQAMIQTLADQDTALADRIRTEEQQRGWLHWLNFLFP